MTKPALIHSVFSILVSCAACEDVVHRENHIVGPGQELPRPSIPYTWHVVDGYAYCPKHVITIETKEERDMRAKTNIKAGIVGGQPATDGQ